MQEVFSISIGNLRCSTQPKARAVLDCSNPHTRRHCSADGTSRCGDSISSVNIEEVEVTDLTARTGPDYHQTRKVFFGRDGWKEIEEVTDLRPA